ncbi:MAG: hypothetical protein ABSG90_11535 [Dehalococcoidia bacterium]|jgi:hypothetical protein
MLRGGVQTDIRTGRPVEFKPDQRKGQVQERFTRSLLDASDMAVALHQNNAVLKVFLKQYTARLEELAATDPKGICQTLEASIGEIRNILEVLPLLRERQAMRVLGPQLASLIEKET